MCPDDFAKIDVDCFMALHIREALDGAAYSSFGVHFAMWALGSFCLARYQIQYR